MLTNLELSYFSREHIQCDWIAFSVPILGGDDQLDLAARVEASHGEVGADGGHVGQDEVAEAVHDLQDEDLVQTSVKPRLTLDLDQLGCLQGTRC